MKKIIQTRFKRLVKYGFDWEIHHTKLYGMLRQIDEADIERAFTIAELYPKVIETIHYIKGIDNPKYYLAGALRKYKREIKIASQYLTERTWARTLKEDRRIYSRALNELGIQWGQEKVKLPWGTYRVASLTPDEAIEVCIKDFIKWTLG